MDKHLYNENSIESLDPLSFTRLRPQVYAGDCTYATQLLVEIVSNAIDEYRLGHGNLIEVGIAADCVWVRDYGQGFIPNSFRDDGKTILEAAFSVLNTSGKYREDGTYEGTSLGSFGIGSKITTFLSHWLEVQTWRDGQTEMITFKEGVFDNRLVGPSDKPSGTFVQWLPSEEFFTHTSVEINKVKELFKTLVCLCPGLTIKLYDNKEDIISFYSENGLNDLIDEAVKDKEIISRRFILNHTNDKYKMDMVLTYGNNYSSTIIPYVNTGLTESGPHITQIKTIITREFNKFFKEKKWLKEKDSNLSGEDLQEGIYIVFNLTAPNVGYDAQVKSRITKIEMTPFSSALSLNFSAWLKSNEKEIKIIFEKATAARKARDAAKKARDKAREGNKKGKKALLNLPTKLVDANSKDRKACELLIVEGDSAAGGLIEARDPEVQAIFPIRGKIIAAYKNAIDKIFANQEVNNLIRAIGLETDAKTGKLIYDSQKLRYGKILMCADGDADGQAIKNLLMELFWWLCPELVLNGHLYSTLPPLFRVTTKKNEYIFLTDSEALEKYKKEHIHETFLINRNKGLGEQDPSELYECLINPVTRNIFQIIVSDKEGANRLMECLMGPSVPPRRAYLLQHSEEANN